MSAAGGGGREPSRRARTAAERCGVCESWRGRGNEKQNDEEHRKVYSTILGPR